MVYFWVWYNFPAMLCVISKLKVKVNVNSSYYSRRDVNITVRAGSSTGGGGEVK